jgi:hypothetical protein
MRAEGMDWSVPTSVWTVSLTYVCLSQWDLLCGDQPRQHSPKSVGTEVPVLVPVLLCRCSWCVCHPDGVPPLPCPSGVGCAAAGV